MALFYYAPALLWHLSFSQTELRVDGYQRIATDDGSNWYEVHTTEGLFHNQDSLLRLKRDSAVLQSELRTGSFYRCSVQGYQLALMDRYRNLIRCIEIDPARADETAES
jgi:hypothetical protein